MKIKRLLFTMSAIIITGGLLTGCGMHYTFNRGFGTNFLDRDDAEEFRVEKTAVDSITSIEINTGMAEVEIIPSDNFYVDIDYLYWEDEPEYSLEDGKLFFDDSSAFPNSYSINFDLDNSVKVYLPKDNLLTDISITDSSGDVSLEGFATDDLSVVVSYGDLTLKEGAAENADVTLSSGTSNIADFQVGRLDFTNSYGDATFTDINTGEPRILDLDYDRFKVSMSSGDAKINGLLTGSLNITDSYGDIVCKNVTADEFDGDLSSGNLEVKASDLKEIDVNDSYGDVIFNLVGQEEDYNYDLGTSYGKVEVGNKDYEEDFHQENGGERSINADLSSGDIKITFQ